MIPIPPQILVALLVGFAAVVGVWRAGAAVYSAGYAAKAAEVAAAAEALNGDLAASNAAIALQHSFAETYNRQTTEEIIAAAGAGGCGPLDDAQLARLNALWRRK